ncbi:hypothetical protein H6H01_25280 [Nostoc calcicola FACHB-3891]|nr:hypothetical protein [Nostoc calcicola FACHB-3891]
MMMYPMGTSSVNCYICIARTMAIPLC